MEKIIIAPELLEVEIHGRKLDYKYRIRTDYASSVFNGIAEIIANYDNGYDDEVCLDLGEEFWKFIGFDTYECDWKPMKRKLYEKWRHREIPSST